MTPGLRAFARALVDGHAAETADEIVQTVLIGALSESGERRGTRLRLFLLSSVLTVNRRALREATLDQQAGARNRTAQQGGVSASQWDMPRVSTNRNAVLLDDMPLEWRETLLLVALEELTYIQTAECLGVTLNGRGYLATDGRRLQWSARRLRKSGADPRRRRQRCALNIHSGPRDPRSQSPHPAPTPTTPRDVATSWNPSSALTELTRFCLLQMGARKAARLRRKAGRTKKINH